MWTTGNLGSPHWANRQIVDLLLALGPFTTVISVDPQLQNPWLAKHEHLLSAYGSTRLEQRSTEIGEDQRISRRTFSNTVRDEEPLVFPPPPRRAAKGLAYVDQHQ